MNYDQFFNLSCYEELEIQSTLLGISKADVLEEIGHRIGDYYIFIFNDGIFNWYDSNGNRIEDPGIIEELEETYIPKNIAKCVIPNSVTRIGYCVFYSCTSLKEIVVPNTVTSIGDYAFSNCKSLKEINILNSITRIGDYAFSFCRSLKEITIPISVTSIGNYAFYGCESLKEVVFEGKTSTKVKQMKNYPFGIEDESKIKVSEI